MARVLAIDYGTKRVGLAVTDPLKIIASRCNIDHVFIIPEAVMPFKVKCHLFSQ